MTPALYIAIAVAFLLPLLAIISLRNAIYIAAKKEFSPVKTECSSENFWKATYKYNPTTVFKIDAQNILVQANALLEFSPCKKGKYAFSLESRSFNKSLPYISIEKNGDIIKMGFIKKERITVYLDNGDTLSLAFLNQYYRVDGHRSLRVSQPEYVEAE